MRRHSARLRAVPVEKDPSRPDHRAKVTPIACLPNELLLRLFKYLSFDDRLRCERVCSRWRPLAVSAYSKQILIGRELPGVSVWKYSSRAHYTKAKLSRDRATVEKYMYSTQAILDKVGTDPETAVLRCFFGYQPGDEQSLVRFVSLLINVTYLDLSMLGHYLDGANVAGIDLRHVTALQTLLLTIDANFNRFQHLYTINLPYNALASLFVDISSYAFDVDEMLSETALHAALLNKLVIINKRCCYCYLPRFSRRAVQQLLVPRLRVVCLTVCADCVFRALDGIRRHSMSVISAADASHQSGVWNLEVLGLKMVDKVFATGYGTSYVATVESQQDIVFELLTLSPYILNLKHVVIESSGCKKMVRNIIRFLVERGCRTTVHCSKGSSPFEKDDEFYLQFESAEETKFKIHKSINWKEIFTALD